MYSITEDYSGENTGEIWKYIYISQYTVIRNQSKCFKICSGNKFPLE